jgi:hypothetical protein
MVGASCESCFEGTAAPGSPSSSFFEPFVDAPFSEGLWKQWQASRPDFEEKYHQKQVFQNCVIKPSPLPSMLISLTRKSCGSIFSWPVSS